MSAWLFCPGHEPHKLAKALSGPAEVVIADWEDAVPVAEKDRAREVTRELSASKRSKRLFVRINAPNNEMHDEDLRMMAGLNVDGIMLPKSEFGVQVRRVCKIALPVVALIESALGVEHALQIAESDPLVERLAFGPLDYMADVGGRWTPDGAGFSYARQHVILAGRAGGRLGALDGVWPRLGDIAGLRREAEEARTLGYDGKMVIHPEQVEPVATAFTPSEEEIERARRVVTASREAERQGKAALRLEGEFIDPPVVRWAEAVLAKVNSVRETSGRG